MRIALLNSGLGLLAAAAQLHRLRPDADLVLAMDPDGMPWGARTPADIAQRFPGLVPEVPRAFERMVTGRQPLLRIGWAIVRPKTP